MGKIGTKPAWVKSDITLSIGVLVSNNIDTIRGCMESLRPLLKQVNSELIIVDTVGEKQSDGSLAIAKEYADKKAFIEVKGVTLEKEGVVSFPDAPTERGSKHLRELCECIKDGYEAYVFFVIQMKDVLYFTPNEAHAPVFADTLRKAHNEGVKILAYDCFVSEDEMKIENRVEVKI